jgi:hypothetical protein
VTAAGAPLTHPPAAAGAREGGRFPLTAGPGGAIMSGAPDRAGAGRRANSCTDFRAGSGHEFVEGTGALTALT